MIQNMIISSQQGDEQASGLSDRIQEVLIWNIDVLFDQDLIEPGDLAKIKPVFDLAIKSENYANKVDAIQLMNKLIIKHCLQECHL